MAPPYQDINNEYREMFNKVLNKVLKQKYDWFKDMIVNNLSYSGGNIKYIGINADIFVDSEWGHRQWREYNYSKPFPDEDELSFGDIIGGKESKELREEIFTIFTFVTGLPAKNLSYSWIMVHFIESENGDLQENIQRIKEVMGILVETREGLYSWLVEKLPNTPEYVIKDWVYKMIKNSDDVNTKEGITDWIENWVKDLEWEYQKDFPISMDIFTDKTKRELQSRIQGEVRKDVDKDTERHETQKELLKSKGISKEPIILFKTKDGKYELGEGWHRTTQTFILFPNGFIQPNVYIALNAKWLD